MKGGLKVVYTSLFTISLISSCALFILVVSESSLPPVVEHRSNEESNTSSFITKESNDLSENPVEQLNNDVNSDQNNLKDSKPEPQPTVDNTLAFSEAVSQNSGIPVGLPETGQAPIVISLVDTATLNLQDTVDSATPTLFSNYSDQQSETDVYQDDASEGKSIHALDEGERKDKNGHKGGAAKEQPPLVVLAEERKPQPRLDVPLSKEPDHIGADDGEPVDLGDIVSGNGTDAVDEEKPTEDIPSFSEWTQKQLEEAEKHDTVLNHSTHTSQSNNVVSNKNFKMRSKNYASPACGAKVIAVNPEAGSASSMLSPNKDEYMLNTCNSRIWFVVELCEPIQAQKIELANFELFSSTPKDFAVYFSDRYPIRDWTSVGQFTAKDERDVQSFDLFPHLFGKFIKVEFFSHYGSEHYCPISMFKAYGTSEFEVLEKENSHPFPLDEDDDILEEIQGNPAQADISKNLFGSVRDAVMSIMKKAAQVLVKTGDSKNITTTEDINKAKYYRQCCTPSHILVCDNCSDYLFNDVFELMSCKSNELKGLIENAFIYDTLRNSDICEQFGLDLKSKRSFCFKTERALYLSAVFMPSYLAALCNMLAIKEKKVVLNASYEAELRPNMPDNISLVTTEDSNIDEVLTSNTEIVADEGDNIKPNEVIIQDVGKSEFDVNFEGSSTDDFHIVNKVTKETEEMETTNVKSLSDDEKQKSEIDIKHVVPDTDSDVLQNVEGSYTNSNIKEPNDKCSTGDHLMKENVITLPPVVENKDTENPNIQDDRNSEKQSTNAVVPEEVNVQEQIPMDHELSDLDQLMVDPIPPNSTPSPNTKGSNQAQPPQAQKESVFLRLSNRVKALERNMSLSGQYLEELSRRYKKQVEEMQKNFEKTFSSLTDERKKSDERAQRNVEQTILLQQQLNQANSTLLLLMEERDSWFGRISFFKFILYQTIIVSALLLYLRKSTVVETPVARRSKSKKNPGEKPKIRRKSVEGVSGHRTPASKKRRPSEEALRIARLSTNEDEGAHEGSEGAWIIAKPSKNRRRKISVLHKTNPLGIQSETSATSVDQNRSRETIDRQDSIMHMSEDTITLEEHRYVAPGIDPVEFNSINGPKINDTNGVSQTQEMSKANGSINKFTKGSKPGKTRRLSSPAFFRSALSRQSSRSTPSPVVPTVNKNFQFNKEEGERQSSVSPSGSICSSAGDMSLENNSVILGTNGVEITRLDRRYSRNRNSAWNK